MKQENVEGNTYIGKISEIENKNWRRNKFEHPKIAKKGPKIAPNSHKRGEKTAVSVWCEGWATG